jgi:uncharacterized damage-inducible protein DinB
MTAKDVIKSTLQQCRTVARDYIADLNDSDLMIRSVPGVNHIAWQLGHVISSELWMLGQMGHKLPALPADFEAAYTKETSTSDDPRKFHKKSEYLALMEKFEQPVLAAIDATPDAELDTPGPESMRTYAPTVGAALALLGVHWMMHAGQFVPVRRKLGRAPLF